MTDKNNQPVKQENIHTNPKKYSFISCDSDANASVSAICREIRSLGGEYLHDDGRLTGEEWLKQTTDMINGCHEYIVFISKGLLSRENRFVRNEFFFAKKAGKKMYAVMLDKIAAEDIDEGLKKWFSEINERCSVITVPSGASPRETAELMNKAIEFAPDNTVQNKNQKQKKTQSKNSGKAENKNEPADRKDEKEKTSDTPVKKNGKTKFTILGALAAVVFLAASGVFIFQNVSSDSPEKFTYEIVNNEVVVTSLIDNEQTSVSIPAKIENKPVVKIGEAAFSGCTNLKSVKLPNSVKEIDGFAFLFCENLNNVKIPDSVTKIGESAFADCIALKSIKIPDSVVEIGPSVFQGCESLNSVNISDSVKTIGEAAFMNCTSLKKVTVPDSVTSIEGSVFEGCAKLSKVTLSKNIKEISFSSFEGCTELKEIAIPKSVTEIGDYAFSGCSSLKKAVIPASVENIVDSAFSDCNELTIYGQKGSCAEEYAQAHDIPFKEQ